MDSTCEETLRKIVEAAILTTDGFIYAVNIDIREAERERVCDLLRESGYISRYSLIGKDKLQCQVTEKAIRHFEKREQSHN